MTNGNADKESEIEMDMNDKSTKEVTQVKNENGRALEKTCGETKEHSEADSKNPNNDDTTTTTIECDLCAFNTIDIENLRSHMERVHIGALFICFCCSERFVTRYDLKRHKSRSNC